MATVQGLLARVRLELSDARTPFTADVHGDGVTTRFELPHSPVEPETLNVAVYDENDVGRSVSSAEYSVDGPNGAIVLTTPLPTGHTLVIAGVSSKYFSDTELALFLDTAFRQHTHNTGRTMATLPAVEDYLVVLLTTIEVLYALLNDAAFDIDVSTPEGVGIPRSQRFRQLQEMIELRKQQYQELASALNVGISRIEVMTLRRTSRTTGRLVPVFKPQELEDRQPAERVFVPIDSHGAPTIVDPTPVQNIDMFEYGFFSLDIDDLGDLTGWKIDARLRRYEDSSSLREMTVAVRDVAAGHITLELTPRQTAHLPARLYWDLRLTNRETREVRTLVKGNATVVQQVGVDEAIGPVGHW